MITAKILVERLENKEEQKYTFFDEYLNGELEIKPLPLKIILDYVSQVEKSSGNLVKQYDILTEIIFKSVPVFQNEELQETANIKQNKYAIVGKIYNNNMGAMNKVANYIFSIYGLDDEKKQLNIGTE